MIPVVIRSEAKTVAMEVTECIDSRLVGMVRKRPFLVARCNMARFSGNR